MTLECHPEGQCIRTQDHKIPERYGAREGRRAVELNEVEDYGRRRRDIPRMDEILDQGGTDRRNREPSPTGGGSLTPGQVTRALVMRRDERRRSLVVGRVSESWAAWIVCRGGERGNRPVRVKRRMDCRTHGQVLSRPTLVRRKPAHMRRQAQ